MKIYDLELHDKLTLPDGDIQVLKVPGGWIYTITTFEGVTNSVFVPFDKDLKNEGVPYILMDRYTGECYES